MQFVAEFGPQERRVMLLDVGNGSYIELIAPMVDSLTGVAPPLTIRWFI